MVDSFPPSTDENDMNKFTILPSSDKAKSAATAPNLPRGFTEKYPWRSLEVGQSFSIPITDTNENGSFTTIQNSCYKWSKKLNKKFRAFKHDSCIEVARMPDTEFFSVGTVK